MNPPSVLLVAALAGIRLAQAADNVALAGTEYSGLGSYTYVGVISPLGHEHLGNGFVMRNWLERLTYEYDGAAARIHAERFAYAPALGYQAPLAGGSIAVYGGLRIAHLNLSPNDPGNDEEGHTNRVFSTWTPSPPSVHAPRTSSSQPSRPNTTTTISAIASCFARANATFRPGSRREGWARLRGLAGRARPWRDQAR